MIASESIDEVSQLCSGHTTSLLPSATSLSLSAAASGRVNLLPMLTYDAMGSLLGYLERRQIVAFIKAIALTKCLEI